MRIRYFQTAVLPFIFRILGEWLQQEVSGDIEEGLAGWGICTNGAWRQDGRARRPHPFQWSGSDLKEISETVFIMEGKKLFRTKWDDSSRSGLFNFSTPIIWGWSILRGMFNGTPDFHPPHVNGAPVQAATPENVQSRVWFGWNIGTWEVPLGLCSSCSDGLVAARVEVNVGQNSKSPREERDSVWGQSVWRHLSQ